MPELNNLREIGAQEAKARLLEMAEWLDKFCEERDATLFMSGGTLLGAVRHKGFIPWDDDIDVYLPRPQYDKIVSCFKENGNNEKYKLLCHELDENYLYPFAKLIDKSTLLIEKGGYSGIQMGLFIDIFPIDGLGNTVKEAKSQMKKINKYIILNLSLLVAPWRKEVSFLKNLGISVIKVAAKIYGSDRLNKKIRQIAGNKDYNESVFVGEYIDEIGEKRIMNREEIFGGYEKLPFENIELKAPKGWHAFLSQFYGDYMKLPPKEKQVLTHGYELYELTEEKV